MGGSKGFHKTWAEDTLTLGVIVSEILAQVENTKSCGLRVLAPVKHRATLFHHPFSDDHLPLQTACKNQCVQETPTEKCVPTGKPLIRNGAKELGLSNQLGKLLRKTIYSHGQKYVWPSGSWFCPLVGIFVSIQRILKYCQVPSQVKESVL